ncbi:protein of unknown function [Ralstonia solanacearum CFBP2957]|nr:protein of unknown function [Ralstonia solanacearum CFBP2957]
MNETPLALVAAIERFLLATVVDAVAVSSLGADLAWHGPSCVAMQSGASCLGVVRGVT